MQQIRDIEEVLEDFREKYREQETEKESEKKIEDVCNVQSLCIDSAYEVHTLCTHYGFFRVLAVQGITAAILLIAAVVVSFQNPELFGWIKGLFD